MTDTVKPQVRTIHTPEQLTTLLSSTPRVILNCHAPWAAPCTQINNIIATLSTRSTPPHDTPITYASLDPESVPKLLKKYRINTVPTILLFSTTRLVRRIEGADPPALTTSARWLSASSDDTLLRAACDQAVSGDVVLAMKGVPSNPKCGFCKEAVEILNKSGIVFDHINVGADVGVRDMMKKMFNWSTYPMLFARGRLVGGVDRMRELADAGKLVEELSGSGVGEIRKVEKASIEDRLKVLVAREKVMLFMKGSPDAPRCGFSRRIVEVLRAQGITFGSFDILQDEEVRQGLKTFSDWPTFPQLYSSGQFTGGLDVVRELVEAGELKKEMGLE